jgi:hypothetical protein
MDLYALLRVRKFSDIIKGYGYIALVYITVLLMLLDA